MGKKDKQTGLSPTEEEFEVALDNFKEKGCPFIYLFFKSYSNPTEEISEVLKFKESISVRNIGLYHDFKDINEFEGKLQSTLIQYIKKKNYSKNIFETKKMVNPEIASFLENIPYSMARFVCPVGDVLNNMFPYKAGVSLISMLKDKRRIVLLGDAGSGKTVELKKLVKEFSNENTLYYPFYIKLSKCRDKDLKEYLPANWTDVLEEQRLFILDGLDEVESIYRTNVRRSIEELAETYPSSCIIVSCRKNFYNVKTDEISGALQNFDEVIFKNLSNQEYINYVHSVLVRIPKATGQ